MIHEYPYKNEEQLSFLENLCDEYFRYYHGSFDSTPEIEIYVERQYSLSYVRAYIKEVLRNAGFVDDKKIEVHSRNNEYHEVVLSLNDLHLYSRIELNFLMYLLKRETIKFVTNKSEPYTR